MPVVYDHPYIIPDFNGQFEERGTVEKPFLYAVTSGQNNNASLTFHFQIGLTFRQCQIIGVGKEKLYLGCKSNTVPT